MRAAEDRRLAASKDVSLAAERTFRAWVVAWVGGSVLGMVNGTARELVYKDRVGENAAHYISTATLLALLALYVAILQRRWPILSRRDASIIGACWLALTITFEFGFGHYVDGKSWAELRALYDVTEGKIWVVVPLFMAIAPVATVKRQKGGARFARLRRRLGEFGQGGVEKRRDDRK